MLLQQLLILYNSVSELSRKMLDKNYTTQNKLNQVFHNYNIPAPQNIPTGLSRCPTHKKSNGSSGWIRYIPGERISIGNHALGDHYDTVWLNNIQKTNQHKNHHQSSKNQKKDYSIQKKLSSQEQTKLQHECDHATQIIQNTYLNTQKQIDHTELQESSRGEILVPLYHIDDHSFQGYQRIRKEKFEKLYRKGTKPRGGYYRVGSHKSIGSMIIAESYTTGKAIYDLNPGNLSVYTTFGTGNIPIVAHHLHKQYPDQKLCFLSDYDFNKESPTNPGFDKVCETIKEHRNNSFIHIPHFSNPQEYGTDFNDLYCKEGQEAVQKSCAITYYGKNNCILHNSLKLMDMGWYIATRLFHEKRLTVNAPTGSGKTYMFLKYLPNFFTQENIILLVPTKVLAQQISREYNIPGIYAGKQPTNSRIHVSTYDGLLKFSPEYLENALIGCDEIHNFTTAMGYRGDMLRKVVKKLTDIKYVLNLTGTDIQIGRNYSDNILKIEYAQPKEYILKPIKTDNSVLALISLKEQNGGSLWLAFNDKKELESHRMGILAERPNANVCVIYSDIKTKEDLEQYNILLEKALLDPSIDYLLTSSILSEGLNIIEHNIKSIVFGGYFSPHLIKQTISRFRVKPVESIYQLYSEKTVCDFYDSKFSSLRVKQIHDGYTSEAIAKTNNRNKSFSLPDPLKDYIMGNIESSTYQDVYGTWHVCEESVNYQVFDEYDKKVRGDLSLFTKELQRYHINYGESEERLYRIKRDNSEYKEKKEHEILDELELLIEQSDYELNRSWNESILHKQFRELFNYIPDRNLVADILVKNTKKADYLKVLHQAYVEYILQQQKEDIPDYIKKMDTLDSTKKYIVSTKELYREVNRLLCDCDADFKCYKEYLVKTKSKWTDIYINKMLRCFFTIHRTTQRKKNNKRQIEKIITLKKLESLKTRYCGTFSLKRHITPDSLCKKVVQNCIHAFSFLYREDQKGGYKSVVENLETIRILLDELVEPTNETIVSTLVNDDMLCELYKKVELNCIHLFNNRYTEEQKYGYKSVSENLEKIRILLDETNETNVSIEKLQETNVYPDIETNSNIELLPPQNSEITQQSEYNSYNEYIKMSQIYNLFMNIIYRHYLLAIFFQGMLYRNIRCNKCATFAHDSCIRAG